MTNWEEFKLEAHDISRKEVLLKSLIEDVIISRSSFAESISALLARSFAGMITSNAWTSLFKPVFEGFTIILILNHAFLRTLTV